MIEKENLVAGPTSADNTIIFLHGLTSNGVRFKSVAEYLLKKLTPLSFKVILPDAPMREIRWLGERNRAWFDIKNEFFIEEIDYPGLGETISFVQELIKNVKKTTREGKIFLGGFSQGGSAALYAWSKNIHGIDGVFSLSGYLPLEDSAPELRSIKIPLFLALTLKDEIVPVSLFEKTKKLLEHVNSQTQIKGYSHKHLITSGELDDLYLWIKSLSAQKTASL